MNNFNKSLEIHPNNNWMLDLQDNHSGNIIHLEGEGLSDKNSDAIFAAFESSPTYLTVEGFEFIAVN